MKKRRSTPPDTYDFYLPCEFKQQYKSEKEALEGAELRMLENMRIELTVYECPVCRHWHLTRVKNTET
jgi:hypothetical protein